MKTIKSRLLLLMTAVILSVCLCIGLAACGDEAFPAPQNVEVKGTTLSWDAVEEAEGYTVKINDDQTATTATNSLDLKTVTSKLKEGDNTLAVKVNAKEGKLESEYSEAVTYKYTPEEKPPVVEPPAPTAWATPTGLKIENGILSWTAVSGATAYIVACGEQTKEVTAASINLVQFELAEGAKVTFTVKVKASGNKLESAAATSPEYDVPNPTAVINNAKAAIAEVKASLADKDDEAVIVAVEEFKSTYDGYPAYVKEDAEVITAYGELTSALTTAQSNIAAVVDVLKGKVNALTGVIASENITEAYYTTLNGYKTEIEALGAYASTLWTAELTQKVDNEISVLLATPVGEPEKNIFVTGGTEGVITLVYKTVNILGDAIVYTADNAPAAELTVNGGDPVTGKFSCDNAGNCTYTASWTAPAKDPENPDPDYKVLSITYKIGGETEGTPVEYTVFNDASYYFIEYGGVANKAIHGNKLIYEGGDAYFDIYLENDIALGTANSLPTVKGVPLVKRVAVTNGMSVEEFRRYIARRNPVLIDKSYDVRFVIYNEENGVRNTIIDNARVSHDVYTLDLTEEDAKAPISTYNDTVIDVGVWNTGNFSLITLANVPAFVQQFDGAVDGLTIDENNAKDYLQIKITAFASDDTDHTNPLFWVRAPFENQGYNYHTFMEDWAYDHFGKDGADGYEVDFYLTISIVVKEKVGNATNPLLPCFRESKFVNVRVEQAYTGHHKFDIKTVTSPEEQQFNFTASAVEFIRDRDKVYGTTAGDVFRKPEHGVQYIDVLFTKSSTLENGTEGDGFYHIYLFCEDNNLAGYTNLDKTGNRYQAINSIGDAYDTLGNFVGWIQSNYAEAGFSRNDTWYFYTKTVVDIDNLKYLYQGGYSGAIELPAEA